MDPISILGIVLSVSAIVTGQLLEGGSLGSLLQFTAFFIVIGGTMGAVLLQCTPRQFLLGMRLLSWVFIPPRIDPEAQIHEVINWSNNARKNGLLSLEDMISTLEDAFTRKGLQLLIDGAEPAALRNSLEVEIQSYETLQRAAARVWEAAGGYAPTIGIIGAVLGLIHVMENLTDPSKLGAGIAVAFVATIYGVGSANLLFLPIAK